MKRLVTQFPEGGVLLLENIRFYKEETDYVPNFFVELTSIFDVYVNDIFAVSHTFQASIKGFAKYHRPSVVGFLMGKELEYVIGVVSNPKKPFAAIISGSKLSKRIYMITFLLEKVDLLRIGGPMIFPFYKAQEFEFGSAMEEQDMVEHAIGFYFYFF